MPILIILLFYINDLVRIKRYYSQTEFVGQQMANILQNISQKRSDKKITKNDLKYATVLAYQTLYPGLTMYYKGSGYPFSHKPHASVYYITEGTNASTASCRWYERISSLSASSPNSMWEQERNSDHCSSLIRYKSNVSPSQIYSSLKINSEAKIAIEASMMIQNSNGDYNVNGKSIPHKEAFGLHFIKPKCGCSWYFFFPSVVIFTPKPGLFTNANPPAN